MDNSVSGRIEKLRNNMRKTFVDLVILPQTDPHQSEYIAEHWQVRRFFSGFTGSAGTLIVTLDKALLWTDNRYFIQAAEQLRGTEIELMKDGLPETPAINRWILDNITPGATVATNGWLLSMDAYRELKADLETRNIQLKTDFDVVDQIWTDRPPLPSDRVFLHELKYAGESAATKITRVMEELASREVDSLFISALDEIAWILNIRGSDVSCNPVATCFLYLNGNSSVLFIDSVKLTPEVTSHLHKAGVKTLNYEEVLSFLSALSVNEKVLIDPARTSCLVGKKLGDRSVLGESPVALMKAIKNTVQINGFREAMKRDGAALAEGFMEIEKRLKNGVPTTEIDVAEILKDRRARQPLFFDISFDTIAGFAANGAIVHYSATPETNSELKPEGLLLVDSGAQYFDGTTDITRTISLGSPTHQEKRDFTLVLKGMIALDMAVFPKGTRGVQLDILAHQFLWRAGQHYMHGTGHGIGHFLNVHEGPQTIRNNNNTTPLYAGMVTSDEPGLYKPGLHGIRCENCILCVPATIEGSDNFEYLRFETLTLFPFDRNLMDFELLTNDEIKWLNAYHEKVFAEVSPLLDEETKIWLANKTQKISV